MHTLETLPRNANEVIELLLDERMHRIEDAFQADGLAFNGPIYGGVDDILRSSVEGLVSRDSHRDRLVILLTTSGGYIEVVQRMVDTLRHHYEWVIFVIPNYAFSAGTVFAMSGDEIHMDYYSRLGPIDPQVESASGVMVPALGYLVQWERLLEKARAGTLTMVEAQLMIDSNGFDQGHLYQYGQARDLSITLLSEWLVKYKFKNWKVTETRGVKVTSATRLRRAKRIASQLNDTERWHSHGHGISRDVLQNVLKLKIDDLDGNSTAAETVKQYHSLLDDYMIKRSQRGVIHTLGSYAPYISGS
jgi:hypothetical protein